MKHNLQLSDFGLPSPDVSLLNNVRLPSELRTELDFDQDEQAEVRKKNTESFNVEQREAYETIMDAVESNDGGLFSVNAPGGKFKTG